MFRQVAKKLAGLFSDGNFQVVCILGGPYVGKTWLLNDLSDVYRKYPVRIYDDVNSYESFREIIEERISNSSNEKYIVVGRLREEICKKICGSIGNKEILIEYVNVYPMNFEEFRVAIPKIYNIAEDELLKLYMLVGGIPKIVEAFMETGNIGIIQEKQGRLLDRLLDELNNKEKVVLNEVVKQEMSLSPGFVFARINKDARERDYESVINKLINMGVVYKISRYISDEDRNVKKYKLYVYDMGMYMMVTGFGLNDVMDNNGIWNQKLLYNFLIREFFCYISNQNYNIMYWEKVRAKAKIPIVIEKNMNDKSLLIPITFISKENLIPKNIHSFLKENKNALPLYVKKPNAKTIVDGAVLYSCLSNIT